MKGQRTDKTKAMQALAMSEIEGKTSPEISKQTGIPQSTVREILRGDFPRWERLRDDAEYRRYKEQTQRTFELAWAETFRDAITEAQGKVKNASYSQLIFAAAIATDKVRLFRGESTANVVLHEIHEYKGLDALAEKLGQALMLKRAEAAAIEVKPEKTE